MTRIDVLTTILLLIGTLQFQEVSSFASTRTLIHSRSSSPFSLLPRRRTVSSSWTIPPLASPYGDIPKTTSTTSSSTCLYSAAAENLQNLGQINGASVPKGTILLSTNQGIGFGCLLAWTSGMINGATLMGLWSTSQGVAALTGTYTKAALYLAKGELMTSLYYLQCLSVWMAGSTLVGLLIPEPSAFEVKYPRGLALCLAICAASVSYAGIFGNAISGRAFITLCLLANGIQDAISTVMTGNLCRTTHLTGISCDLGTYLGQMLRRGSRDINKTKLKAFPLLAMSFWIGAFMSYPFSTIFGPRMLLGVAGAYLSMAASIGIYFLRK